MPSVYETKRLKKQLQVAHRHAKAMSVRAKAAERYLTSSAIPADIVARATSLRDASEAFEAAIVAFKASIQ